MNVDLEPVYIDVIAGRKTVGGFPGPTGKSMVTKMTSCYRFDDI